MRVIGGIYRRRTLRGPDGVSARPTSDRLRETVFNILQPVIDGARFLDLCAGSGSVGIEALSRGASHTTFVDRSAAMSALVRANVEHCRIPFQDFRIVTSEAAGFLRAADEIWDLVYYDPPYEADYEPVLKYFADHSSRRLDRNARVLVEHHHMKKLPEILGELVVVRQVKQGETWVTVYQQPS